MQLNPARQANESQADYRARRQLTKRHAQMVTATGPFTVSGGVGSRESLRNEMRKSGTMGKRTRAYQALMAAWAAKRVPFFHGPRDEHGAYTLTGQPQYAADAINPNHGRRMWLAGISAQRGF